jgi:prepilin-type N-terminal cleavage/methylation domain-containing protein
MYRSKSQRGFSLTEVMVAAALFTVIVLAALLIYDRNNRVFKQGVESSELQQNTRIGFDRLVSELRMEGFDFDRDGVPSGSGAGGVSYQEQPDEQIEYMGATAITFRANLNYSQDPDNGREIAYEGPAFPLVTTSNKEIVTYALKSADATKNTQDIVFYADVAKPRKVYSGTGGEASERKVILHGFDLTNANPPYTLYRITLKDKDIADSDADPIGPASDPTSGTLAAVVSNVRSLNFTYYEDQAGDTELAPQNGDGQYVVGGGDVAQRTTRAQVKSILVQLVGMNENPDQSYTNTDTMTSMTHYREVTLSSLIIPRNAGKKSIKEESLTAPGKPSLKTICYGACAVPYLTWQAPSSGQVDFYAITYDTSPTGTFAGGFAVGNVTEAYFPLALLPPDQTMYFKIQASNGYGTSLSDNMVSVAPIASTKPSPPVSPAANNGLHAVTLTWNVPTAFASPNNIYSCTDPNGAAAGTYSPPIIPPAEHFKYRVVRYEGNKPNFDPAVEGTAIANETIGNQPSIIAGVATLVDYVPGCTDFYYRIQAVASDCLGSGTYNSTGNTSLSVSDWAPAVGSSALHGYATANANPSAATGLTVTRAPSCPTAANTRGPGLACDMTLVFNKVTTDVNSQPLKVNSYTVKRTQVYPTGTGTVDLSSQVPADPYATAGSTITITDPGVPLTDASGVSYQWQYSVVANDCTYKSTAATVNEPLCYFATSPLVTSSALGGGGNGSYNTPYQMQLDDTITINATSTTAFTANVKDPAGNLVQTFTGASNPFTITWPGYNVNSQYTIDVQLKNASNCYYTFTLWVVDEPGVCVYGGAPTASPNPAQGNVGSQANPFTLKIGDTLKWTKADLKDVQFKITDTSTNVQVASGTANAVATVSTLTWPSLTNNKTYRIDAIVEQTTFCQAQQTYFVTQTCSGYSGGAPAFSTSDSNPAHTGATQALEWQINTGGTITVSELKMVQLNLKVTDLTAGTQPVSLTSTGLVGTKSITWPPNGVTGAFNHTFQLDFVLIDSSGCSSTTTTRFLGQFCTYKSGQAFTITPTVTQTPQPALGSPIAGAGTVSPVDPFLMVPNLDQFTVSESSSLAKVIVNYKDSTNTVRGTQTITGTNPIKFTNPLLATPGNGAVYTMELTLEDTNGCQTTTVTKYAMKQIPCALQIASSATDTNVFVVVSSVSVGGTNGNALDVKLTNKSAYPLTISSISFAGYSLSGQKKFAKVQFPTTSDIVVIPSGQTQSGPVTVIPTLTETIAAGTTGTVRTLWTPTNNNPTQSSFTKVCITYTTTAPATTQSCNINFQATPSQTNPGACN